MFKTSLQALDHLELHRVHINKNSVDSQIDTILKNNPVSSPGNVKNWLLKVITLIDLTTLSGDDTRCNVTRLCHRAANPLSVELKEKIKPVKDIKTAAVCVYPARVQDVCNVFDKLNLKTDIKIAVVATGFPSGLYPLETRLQEIKLAIKEGATEIDVVIDRSLVLTGKWETLYDEICDMREACGDVHLKVILGVGELGSYENIYKAAMVSMAAGADFIKTSTGKEAVNATLPIGLVMCRAIRKHYQMTGKKVGLKPAGGIKTARDAINWLILVYTELGVEWLCPEYFRIGASSLLDDILKELSNIKEPVDDNPC